jgi:hypothetical protein
MRSAGIRFRGRLDLAVDVQTSGSYAESFLRGLLEDTDGDLRYGWCSRSKVDPERYGPTPNASRDYYLKRSGEPGGRSRTVKGSDVRFTIYEKSRHAAGDVLRNVWADNGWDGVSTVLRIEFQIKRSWIRGQQVGGRPGDKLSFDEYLRCLPAVWRELTKRHRHVRLRTPRQRPERAPLSPFWKAVSKGFDAWEPTIGEGPCWPEIHSAKQRADAQKILERMVRDTVRLEALGTPDGVDAIDLIMRERGRPEREREFAILREKIRALHGMSNVEGASSEAPASSEAGPNADRLDGAEPVTPCRPGDKERGQ